MSIKTKPTPDKATPQQEPFEERIQAWLNNNNALLRTVLGVAIVITVFVASLVSYKHRRERSAVEAYMSALGTEDESKRAEELRAVAEKYPDMETVRQLALVDMIRTLLRKSKYEEAARHAEIFLKEFPKSAYRTSVASMRTIALEADKFLRENENLLEKISTLHVVNDPGSVYRFSPVADARISFESKKGLVKLVIFSHLLKNDADSLGAAFSDLKKSLTDVIKDKSVLKIEGGVLRVGSGTKTEGKYSFSNPGTPFQPGDVVCKFTGDAADLGTLGIVIDEKTVSPDYRVIGSCETPMDIVKAGAEEPISDVEISVP